MKFRENLLSVIVPVYNRETLIRRAICSVLDQALPEGWDLELIVVDDGSSDRTRSSALESCGDDPRTLVLTKPPGGTPGGARNYGVCRASGALLAFLDSDDTWLPGKLLRQIPLHHPGGAIVSHTRERWIRGEREISQEGRRFSAYRRSGDLLKDSLVKCIIGPSTVMIGRSLWEETGGFREDLEVAEDYEYWLRLATLADVSYLQEPFTVKYAGHGDQLSEKYGHIELFRLQGLRDLVENRWFLRCRGDSAQELAENELGRKALIYARGALKRGRTGEAEEYHALAQRYGSQDCDILELL
ncbi:Glycosyltransferase involved in cell wall bisynthesis [Alkalispirochaeta americana]|uniref:Glycosyltransferase involved in cell wall bisynthesis n=1 Tax=Alkalispirochaeta americana TaxID=159291 RepID=A0A1N6V9D4_9SPIO|nr:glycosyltransferase family A protein [Alkalispirochaeta americana]SIQ74483.1 Glycosyltransferase involved in cell wall bisynthesis [Alkalispirochaeta americana]